MPTDPAPSFYKHHIFFCLNKRDGDDRECCHDDAEPCRGYARRGQTAGLLSGPVRSGEQVGLSSTVANSSPSPSFIPDNVLVHLVRRTDSDETAESHLRDAILSKGCPCPDA